MMVKTAMNKASVVGFSLALSLVLAACNEGFEDKESSSALASEDSESTMQVFKGQLYCQSSDGSRDVRINILHDESLFDGLWESEGKDVKVSMVLEREVPNRDYYESSLFHNVAFNISRPDDTGVFVYELIEPALLEGFEFEGRFNEQIKNLSGYFKDEDGGTHLIKCNKYELDI